MRTSLFALVAAAYMASSGQAIALEDNLTDFYPQDTLTLAQDKVATGNELDDEYADNELRAVKMGLTSTTTRNGS